MNLTPSDSLIADVYQLFRSIKFKRRRQLLMLVGMMVLSAISEIASLGAIIPFLSALNDPVRLLRDQQIELLLEALKITKASQLVLSLTILFVTIIILSNLLRIAVLYVQTRLSALISTEIGCLVYERILLQPYEHHIRQNSSDLITLVSTDTAIISNGILGPTLSVVSNSFVTLALLAGLFAINPISMLVALFALGTTYSLIYQWKRGSLLKNSQLMVNHNQQQIKVVQESLGGIQDIILAGTYPFFQSRYARSNHIVQTAYASILMTSSVPRYGIEMIAMVFIGLLALSLRRDGDFGQAVPILGGLALGVYRLLPALQQLFSALTRVQGSRASLTRVLAALRRPIDPTLKDSIEPLYLEQVIQLKDIWFRYQHESEWILKDINLSINSRTTVGFVGTTGSGKSTTANLLLGFLNPEQGQVVVDGNPLHGERLRAWQLGLAHVPQRIFLADTSIVNNIAFGVPPNMINYHRVREAADLAQLGGFIGKLPEKYETILGEHGVRLSGGQQQRIGIARALYHQASVIIFDEATSSLDAETEKEVMAAINGLRHTITIVLIAHRLSTIQTCDRIFEFQDGRIIASGTYNELLKSSVSFRRLTQTR